MYILLIAKVVRITMACDTFSSEAANNLLGGKFICIFGGSNIRSLYKDLIWLLEDGRLSSETMLKTKNEESHSNDIRLSNGPLHNGIHYEEVREYNRNCHITFQFITRLYQTNFIDFIKSIETLSKVPDVVIINSCLWDLTRWGTTGIQQFKKNVFDTLTYLQSCWRSTRIIWLTAAPLAFQCYGGMLAEHNGYVRKSLPWHVLFANNYAANVANSLNIDVLDLHYYFRFLMNYQVKDGIHWMPLTVRFAVNLLLTHIASVWSVKLPGVSVLSRRFLIESTRLNILPLYQSEVKNNIRRRRRRRCRNFNRNRYYI
ncbi:hypothetical protein RI129_006137 [Pyrocoelia pectoralis]|uniref:PC-esterase domain-containing protein 1A n=1 Tax=Pyrocoelia pectoralis TaxID=417401 RepID=A0AAN7ZI38_9COLE